MAIGNEELTHNDFPITSAWEQEEQNNTKEQKNVRRGK